MSAPSQGKAEARFNARPLFRAGVFTTQREAGEAAALWCDLARDVELDPSYRVFPKDIRRHGVVLTVWCCVVKTEQKASPGE